MKTRIITAIVALAAFIGILILPPIAFTIALAAVTVIMLCECYKATNADTAMKVVGFVSAALLMITMFHTGEMLGGNTGFDILNGMEATLMFVFVSAVIILLLYLMLVIFKHGKRDYKDILSSGFLTLYIIVSMMCVLYCKSFFGTRNMLLVFISAWATDTFAYFSGRLFGKHKLIPHVSPNKTVEGSIGGIVGAVVCCLVYFAVMVKFMDGGSVISGQYWQMNALFAVIYGVIPGLIGGVCSQLGDLTASAVKRDAGIKDFGWIFPGHGGFMDRFDSVMFVAPVMLIFLIFTLAI